ncbi:unnamed protein product, partial [Rotaria sp. Silwood1]
MDGGESLVRISFTSAFSLPIPIISDCSPHGCQHGSCTF